MRKPFVAEAEPLEPHVNRKALLVACLGIHDIMSRETDDALRALQISRMGNIAVIQSQIEAFREERRNDAELRTRTEGDPEISFGLGLLHGMVIGIRAARYAIKGKDFINEMIERVEAGGFMNHEDILECSKCGRRGPKPEGYDEKMEAARADAKEMMEQHGIEHSDEDIEPQALCVECAGSLVKDLFVRMARRGSD